MKSKRTGCTFRGGIHPEEFKAYTQSKSIEALPVPKKMIIPLSQHIGAPCKALVAKGDEVRAGQKIGEAGSFISAPVHASVDGKVTGVEEMPHPLGGKVLSVVITPAAQQGEIELRQRSLDELTPDEIKEAIKEAGIVGLGGATFPTAVKLAPPPEKTVDTLLLNGCECEPFLTSDHRVMLERADDLIDGCRVLQKAMGIQKVVIGIEDNKLDAIEKLKSKLIDDPQISVLALKVKYPQGAEKMLIDAALGRKVPPGKLPLEVGVVVVNVGTVVAVSDAVLRGKPLIERVVTVSGDGVEEPKNVLVKIGTPFADVLDYCGGIKTNTTRVIMGGPMMGLSQHTLEVPVIKGTSGIVCLTDVSEKDYEYSDCIRCGRCVEVCPLRLLPSKIGIAVERAREDLMEEYRVADCMECGSCVYVCPAKRPMVQWVKVGKAKLRDRNRKK